MGEKWINYHSQLTLWKLVDPLQPHLTTQQQCFNFIPNTVVTAETLCFTSQRSLVGVAVCNAATRVRAGFFPTLTSPRPTPALTLQMPNPLNSTIK